MVYDLYLLSYVHSNIGRGFGIYLHVLLAVPTISKTAIKTIVVMLIISSCHHINKRTKTIEIVTYAHEFHILMVNIAMLM